MHSKSVTDELAERNPEMTRVEEMQAQLDAKLDAEPAAAHDPEALGLAKLRVAFATRDQAHAPKPTGVIFVGKSTGSKQEIYDDGSVRNPYKRNRAMTGRQRRMMRKQANRTMKARGINARLEDVLKGRRPSHMEVTPPAPAPPIEAGMPVADIISEQ